MRVITNGPYIKIGTCTEGHEHNVRILQSQMPGRLKLSTQRPPLLPQLRPARTVLEHEGRQAPANVLFAAVFKTLQFTHTNAAKVKNVLACVQNFALLNGNHAHVVLEKEPIVYLCRVKFERVWGFLRVERTTPLAINHGVDEARLSDIL